MSVDIGSPASTTNPVASLIAGNLQERIIRKIMRDADIERAQARRVLYDTLAAIRQLVEGQAIDLTKLPEEQLEELEYGSDAFKRCAAPYVQFCIELAARVARKDRYLSRCGGEHLEAARALHRLAVAELERR